MILDLPIDGGQSSTVEKLLSFSSNSICSGLVSRNTDNCSKKITTSDNLYRSDYTPKWYLRATPIKQDVLA